MGKLITERVEAIVQGLSKACQEVNCALIGGETAEMPGIYTADDYDLVGFIIGAVEKEKIIDGTTITAGDIAIGLASSGLHTNGYSLARKIFGDTTSALNKYYPEFGETIGEALLEPHRCYYNRLKPVLPLVKGMAHITGGGLIGNVPRILPGGLAVKFNSKSWAIPSIFQLIQKQGNIDKEEMYRVFNMGIGMVLICSPNEAEQLIKQLPESKAIGEVVKQTGEERVIII
jgi:phosphoribosylformylglycinamidine cyclo-ligase